jgi:hypothetical protein
MVHRPIEALSLAVAFAIAHTQSPLAYSNQNQYLLHGAAMAGDGLLANDWLANTTDPTPLFSIIVAGLFRLHPFLIQVAFFLLLMGYYLIARRIAIGLGCASTIARLGFAFGFTLIHAGIIRWLSIRLFGIDYPWFFQAGLAAQYLVGPGLQPSAFGVLLLAAVAAMIERRSPIIVAVLAALPCLIHCTYLLPAGLIVLGMLIVERRAGQSWWTLALAGGTALAIVAWPIALIVRDFLSEPMNRAEAMRLLADVRIPHHCRPVRWFDAIAGAQIVGMIAGLWLLRRTVAGQSLGIAFIIATVLSVVQIATESHALALLFPWRLSVVLVPLATMTMLVLAINVRLPFREPGVTISPRPKDRIVTSGFFAAPWIVGVSGLVVMFIGLGYRTADDERPLYRHLRSTALPGEVYFIPAIFPKVSTGRGAVSNTFAPPPRAAAGTNQIPVDLQRTRLLGGVPIFVDFKSVPYRASEVLEWNRRMTLADEWTKQPDWSNPERLAAMLREGITHAIIPATQSIPGGTETYRDEHFAVVKLPTS